jgi:hypothetical protein
MRKGLQNIIKNVYNNIQSQAEYRTILIIIRKKMIDRYKENSRDEFFFQFGSRNN